MRLLIAAGADLRADAAAALNASLLSRCRACAELVIGALDARAISQTLGNMVRYGEMDGVRFLLDRGADVNARDGAGRTPLMIAAQTDAYPVDIVRLLLEKGADKTVRGNGGETAASLAAVRGGPLAELIGRPETGRAGRRRPRPRRRVRRAKRWRARCRRCRRPTRSFSRRAAASSCHHDSLTAHTVKQARAASLPIDQGLAASHREAPAALPRQLAGQHPARLRHPGRSGHGRLRGVGRGGRRGRGRRGHRRDDLLPQGSADAGWMVAPRREPSTDRVQRDRGHGAGDALAAALRPAAWRKDYDAAVAPRRVGCPPPSRARPRIARFNCSASCGPAEIGR